MTQDATRERSSHRLTRYWLPVLAYVALIFFVSAQPRLSPPFHFQNSDKFAHVGEYAMLGLLLVRALRSTPRLAGPLAGGLAAILIGVVVGGGDELFQSTVPGRESSVLDWLADTSGLVMAQILYLALRRS